MDRREFLHSILAAPVFSPLLTPPQSGFEHGAIHLISDRPRFDILPFLEKYRKFAGSGMNSFAFINPDTHSNDLAPVLSRNGWTAAGRPENARVVFSFHRLKQKSLPSATLVQNGRIVDIRSWLRAPLLRPHRESRPSSLLTIASFAGIYPAGKAGESVSLYMNGRKILQSPLNKNTTHIIPAKKGHIAVKIDRRRAWIQASPCPNKICTSTPPVSMAGERIICAPNHFLLEVQGRGVDTVIG